MAEWRRHIRRFGVVSLLCSFSAISYAQDASSLTQSLPMPDQMQNSPETESTLNRLTENVGSLFQSIQGAEQSTNETVVDSAPALAKTSLGGFVVSMMYTQEDISNLSRVLEVYEASIVPDVGVAQGVDTGEQDILSELLRSMQGEGELGDEEVTFKPLPKFYVGTIMYRRAGDWAVWINGERYDNNRKVEPEDELQIVGIGRERVTISWKPEQLPHAYEKWKNRANPNLGKSNHRHAYNSYVSFDETKRRFTISMRSNQTFVGENMDIIEGRVISNANLQQASSIEQDAEAMGTEVEGSPAEQAAPAVPLQNSASHQSQERQISEELIGNIEKLQQFIPVAQEPKP